MIKSKNYEFIIYIIHLMDGKWKHLLYAVASSVHNKLMKIFILH